MGLMGFNGDIMGFNGDINGWVDWGAILGIHGDVFDQLRDVYVVICVILLAGGSEYTEQACGGDEYPL